jgi:hypothetical protein
MSLPRVAISGRANGGRLIFLFCLNLLFFLSLLLLYPLISLSPHLFEVVVLITQIAISRITGCIKRESYGILERGSDGIGFRIIAEVFLDQHPPSSI